MGIVNQTIEDGVSDRWIGKASVPLDNGHLSGHQRRGSAVAIIQDLEQVLRLESGQRISEPVVKDQKLDTGEGIEEFGVGAIGVGQSGLVQKAGGALVADIEVVAAGGVGESAGQEGLAHTGWAEDEDVEVLTDPFALGELENEAPVKATRGRDVQVFDSGR